MATQRKGDHLNRRIPESKEEGAFDRDLHRTLDLTVGQVNELEGRVESLLSGEDLDLGGGSGGSEGPGGSSGDISAVEDRVSELESRLDSFAGQIGSLEEQVEQIGFEARDEVFTEPIELRASTSEIYGSGPRGAHAVEFDTEALSFEKMESGNRPLTLRKGAAEFEEKARFLGTGGEKAEMWAKANGNLKIHPQRRDPSTSGLAPADVEIEAGGVLPAEPYETSLGSERKKYQSIHAAELWIESLVAQEKIATIGGSIFVGPTTELTRPLSGDRSDAGSRPAHDFYNYIRVKHNQMAPGDVVMLDNFTRVEFLRVEAGPVEIEAEDNEEGGEDSPFDFYRDHNYRYRVERDLDGSGANNWEEGAAVANTGRKGSGFIDLYATRSRRAESESGPSVAISVRSEDKASYGQGPWAAGADYSAGDIVYWDSEEWAAGASYSAGDIVYYPPRDQHYVAQTGHTSSESDKPLEASPKWSESDLPADTNFAAQTGHTASESDLPLSESPRWSEVDVTDYFNQWEERSAIGNLDGLYDYNGDVYGVACEGWVMRAGGDAGRPGGSGAPAGCRRGFPGRAAGGLMFLSRLGLLYLGGDRRTFLRTEGQLP